MGPLQGAKIGAIVSLGFTSVFLVIGALASFAGAQVEPYLPWMAMGVGVILIVLGVLWLLKVNLSLPYAPHVPPGGRYLSFFIFGATYAIASAACVFPVFLMIVFAAVSSGEVLSGLVIFLAYSLGMAVVMIPLSIAVSASRDLVLRNFTRAAPLMRKIGAVILIIAGTYLIYLQSLVLL